MTCTAIGCDSPIQAPTLRLCKSHYERQRAGTLRRAPKPVIQLVDHERLVRELQNSGGWVECGRPRS